MTGPLSPAQDEAVSVIVGAILLSGIVLGALVTVRLTFVPVWEETAEAAHMDEIGQAMTELTSDVNKRLDNRTRAPVNTPVPMVASSSQNIFSSSRSPGRLEFSPSQAPVRIETPSFLVQVRNDTDLAGVNETWDAVGSSNELEDVTETLNLRMNITGPPCGGNVENCFSSDAHVTGTIIDSRGKFAGDIKAYLHHPPASSTSFIKVQVRAPTSPPSTVFNNSVLSFQQTDWDPPYWVNTLNADFRFQRLLDAARAPYDVILTEQELDGTFSATYAQSTTGSGGGGTIIVGGGGIETLNYNKLFSTGTLRFESDNLHYPNQAYIIENGALILEQSEGSVFKVDPPISINTGGGAAIVNIGVPTLTGESTSFTGASTASVRLSTQTSQKVVGTSGAMNFTFHTEHPQLWSGFLEEELGRADLTTTGSNCVPATKTDKCQFALSSSSSAVSLTLFGPTAKDDWVSPSTRDISITYNQGTIRTEIRQ